MCYCYFRLGKALERMPIEEKIVVGLFLCSDKPNEILSNLKPEWNERLGLPFAGKLSSVNNSFSSQNIFPWINELSEALDKDAFIFSHLQQPDLFLRLRPGHEKAVKQKLQQKEIEFEIISDTCLSLPNSTKIDSVIELDKEAVVQDYSSQRVGEFLKSSIFNPKSKISVWDCCAGSGGKSIMLHDLIPGIELSVSDVRESILANLKKRFQGAGIRKYKATVIDLTAGNIQHSIINNPRLTDSVGQEYSIIIADVPCTGSGTWGRTPEQLYYFEEKKIIEYASLQKKIVSNVIPHLEPGGYLLYITCSVFKKENEELVDFIKEKFHLQEVKMELLRGYNKKADTMFAALLQKPL